MPREYERRVVTRSVANWPLDLPYYNSFEDAAHFMAVSKSNTSGAATIETTKANRGKQSLKLDTGATTPLANQVITVDQQIDTIEPGLIKMKCMVDQNAQTELNYFIGGTFVTKNPNKRVSPFITVEISGGAYTFYYDAGDAVNVQFAQLSFNGGGRFAPIEFVINTQTGKFLHALIRSKKYDLSTVSLAIANVSNPDELGSVVIGVRTLAAAQKVIYIDDVLVEPGVS